MTDYQFSTILTASPLVCTGRVLDRTRPEPPGKVSLAVSTRKAWSRYNGPCMRVRRTSDNSERDIYFVETDLDINGLLQFTNGFDGYVSVWYDQSGEGHDMVQPVWRLQPKIVANGDIIADTSLARPTIRFDGGYMISTWLPETDEMKESSVTSVVSAGLPTYAPDGNVALVQRQTGTVSEYDTGNINTVIPDYPNTDLPVGYDIFALESHTRDGTTYYPGRDGTYYDVSVNRSTNPPTVTTADSGYDVETGPSVVTATKILPRFNDDTLLFPNTANDEYIDGAVGTNGLMYCVPWNARYVLEINESGATDAQGDPVATSRPLEASDLGTGSYKYEVAIEHTDGVYGIPYNAGNLLYINTTVSPATVHQVAVPALAGSAMFRAAEKVGNSVYCIPYNSSHVVKITLNGTSSTATTIGSSIPGNYKFATSVYVKSRWVVSAPFYAGSFLVIDTSNDTLDLKYTTGGYFEVPGRGRGYVLGADRTVQTDATQNGGTHAQGTVAIRASQILSAVTIDGGNYGYYSTPAVRVNVGVHTYRAPQVTMNMADDGTGNDTYKVDSVTITDAGDNVEGCSITLLGGKGRNARARAYVTIDPTTGQGEVAYVSIIDPGTGYSEKDDITIRVSGGRRSNGTDAILRVDELYPISEGGGIKLISVVSGGSRYVRNPSVIISGGKGEDATLTTHLRTDGHLHLNVDTPGSGYAGGAGFNELTASGLSAQAFFDAYANGQRTGTPFGIIQIQAPNDATTTDGNGVVLRGNPAGATGGSTGIGSYPAACAYIKNTNASGGITEIGIISAGSGYIATPTVTFNSGSGSGAQITATVVQDGKLDWYPTTTDDGSKFTEGYVPSSLASTRDPVYTDDTVIPGSAGSLHFILEGEIPDPNTGQPIQYVYKTNRINRRHGESKFWAMEYDSVAQRIYVAPWDTHRVLSLQTDTSLIGKPDQIKGNMGTAGGKYSDIVIDTSLLGVGQTPIAYGIPYNYRYVLTMTNATTADYIRSPNGRVRRFDGQWNQGVLAQGSGIIYGVPANENSVLMIDAKRDASGTPLNPLSTLEFFGNVRARGNKFGGAIVAPSTSLYFIPRYAPFVVELNPGTSTLRTSALPDTIVFPTSDPTLAPIQPKSFGYDITFADGVELPNGNVVFVPSYNISDPFPYDGKILEVNPSAGTHHLHPESIPFTHTPPFPSRSSVVLSSADTTRVAWIPRAHPDQDALMVWDADTKALESLGTRDVNQAEVGYATQVQNPDDPLKSVGTIPTNTVISRSLTTTDDNAIETDFFPSNIYFNQLNVWRFADVVVDTYDRLFFIPATVSRQNTKILIGYPRPPWPQTLKPTGVPFNIDSSFPLHGTARDSARLTYPTEIAIREGFWGLWTPPPPRNKGDQIAIAFGGAAFCGTDQRVYAVPFNAPNGLVIDPVFHEYEALGVFSTYTDTPITRSETQRNGSIRTYAQQMYRGCIEAANAKLYGIPYGANNVCEIDPTVADASVRSTFIDTTISSLLPPGDDGFFYQLVEGYFESSSNPTDFFTGGQQEIIRTGYTTDLSSISAATGGSTTVQTFSALVTGTFQAPATGTYTFSTTSDDASYLWVTPIDVPITKTLEPDLAGSPLVNNGGRHGSQTRSNTITLQSGSYYTITVMYGESGGSEALSVSVTLPNTSVLSSDWSSVITAPPGGQNYNAKWWGAARGRNNKLYCVPYDADCVLVITPGEGTTPTSITIPPTLQGIGSRGGGKWANAVVAENGNIYCCPVNADTILKIVPGLNGESDQYSLIPFFAGSGKVWGGVYSTSDGFIYFFPGFQNSTVLRFDPESETYDRLGDLFGSSDYRFPGRWTTRPAVLTNGDAYVFPGRGVNTALRLSPGQDRLFSVSISDETTPYALGQAITNQFKLRPFTVQYPEEQQNLLVFHNDDTYGMYITDPPNEVAGQMPLVTGPALPNGVIVPFSDSVSFASLTKATLHTIDCFQGGITGILSPTNRADLAHVVVEPSLRTHHGSDTIDVRNIFRTVFGRGQMGIIGSFASVYNANDTSKNTIVSYVREAPVLETRGYTVSGPVDGFVSVGTVQGFQDRQVTCPLVSSIISSVTASSTAAGTNVSNTVGTDISSIWQSGAGTYDTESGAYVTSPSYIDIGCVEPFRLNAFALVTAQDDPVSMPNSITVLAKATAGSSWTAIETFNEIEKTAYTKFEKRRFVMATCGFNVAYRFQIDSVFPGSTTAQLSQLIVDGKNVALDSGGSPTTVPKITSQFSGHISEVLMVSQSDQEQREYTRNQTFYYTFSRSSAFTTDNVTR